jgi:broad specificity phosphatase PhoE
MDRTQVIVRHGETEWNLKLIRQGISIARSFQASQRG